MWIDDQILKEFDQPIFLKVFTPESIAVVMGSGNEASTEVNIEGCQNLGIPVLRRYGGGGTVVLYPGCVVISMGCWVKEQFNNSRYFESINNSVIQSLATEWKSLSRLAQAGISDIVIGEKKVAGTSLFRSRNYLLYQASLLVDLDRTLVEKLLLHPTKEPDYRGGRSHGEFLTSLAEIEGSIKSADQVAMHLNQVLLGTVTRELENQLVSPIDNQKAALVERLKRATEGS